MTITFTKDKYNFPIYDTGIPDDEETLAISHEFEVETGGLPLRGRLIAVDATDAELNDCQRLVEALAKGYRVTGQKKISQQVELLEKKIVAFKEKYPNITIENLSIPSELSKRVFTDPDRLQSHFNTLIQSTPETAPSQKAKDFTAFADELVSCYQLRARLEKPSSKKHSFIQLLDFTRQLQKTKDLFVQLQKKYGEFSFPENQWPLPLPKGPLTNFAQAYVACERLAQRMTNLTTLFAFRKQLQEAKKQFESLPEKTILKTLVHFPEDQVIREEFQIELPKNPRDKKILEIGFVALRTPYTLADEEVAKDSIELVFLLNQAYRLAAQERTLDTVKALRTHLNAVHDRLVDYKKNHPYIVIENFILPSEPVNEIGFPVIQADGTVEEIYFDLEEQSFLSDYKNILQDCQHLISASKETPTLFHTLFQKFKTKYPTIKIRNLESLRLSPEPRTPSPFSKKPEKRFPSPLPFKQ